MLEQRAAKWRKELRAEGLAEGFTRGIDQGRAEGLARGRAEGERRILQRQIAFKFGPLEPTVRRRIAAARSEQLTNWAERLLVASTLGEVFEAS